MVIGPLLATVGFACLLAFIVLIARPPHDFSDTAKGLLIVAVLLYFMVGVLALCWGMAILPIKYGMWLRSFEPGWEEGNAGWWGRYVMIEKALGRWEHIAYTSVVTLGEVTKRRWDESTRKWGMRRSRPQIETNV